MTIDTIADINFLIKSFKKNRIKTTLLQNSKALIKFLEDAIPINSIVGVGDSVTLEEAGVYDFLRSGSFNFLDKYDKSLTPEAKREIYLKNFDADFFISGANAITIDGKILNMDGNGSRVAPMIYGPRKVFFDCGSE